MKLSKNLVYIRQKAFDIHGNYALKSRHKFTWFNLPDLRLNVSQIYYRKSL